MRQIVAALVAGTLFGAGLTLSRMIDPAKVLGFLDITGDWDPSLVFVLAGAIMAEGGMAARLINVAKIFVGFIRGGLALVNILASTFFGAISGSSVADTASVGSVMIPEMIRNGYPRLFAVNVTISGSLQPLLLPPSCVAQ